MPDWNQIVRLNAANVLNAAFRILGNLADAEDVSQEVLTEAYRKWHVNPDQQWAGILKRMSICRAIDFLRAKRPAQSLIAEVVDRNSHEPMEVAICNELHQQLRQAISQLPHREYEVFCLMYFERQSHEQIASQLSISRAAVATALSKARSKLEFAFRDINTGESK